MVLWLTRLAAFAVTAGLATGGGTPGVCADETPLEQALDRAQAAGRGGEGPGAWEAVAKLAEELGELDKAVAYWNEAAWACENTGQLGRAIACLDHERGIHQSRGNAEQQAKCLMQIAFIYDKAGQFLEGLEARKRSVPLWRESESEVGLAWAEAGIALQDHREGRYDVAVPAYERAIAVFAKKGATSLQGTFMNNLGEALRETDRLDEAAECFRAYVDLVKDIDRGFQVAQGLTNLGNVYFEKADYDRALDYHLKALSHAANIEIRSHTMENIASLYQLMGDYPNARLYYGAALSLARDFGSREEELRALSGLGTVLLETGLCPEAVERFEEGLRLSTELALRTRMADFRERLGEACRVVGHYPEARLDLERALALYREEGRRREAATVLLGLARVGQQAGEYSAALQSVAQAREGMGDDPLLSMKAGITEGDSLTCLSRLDDAAEAYRSAMVAAERVREGSADPYVAAQIGASGSVAYARLVGLEAQRGRPEEAFACAERGRGQALLHVLAAGGMRLTRGMTEDEVREEQQLLGRVGLLTRQLARTDEQTDTDRLHREREEARRLLREFQTALLARHPELAVRRAEVSPLTVEEARSFLPDHTAIVEFVVDEDRTTVLVVPDRSGRQPVAFVLDVGHAALAEKTRLLTAQLNQMRRRPDGRTDGYRQTAETFHLQLLGPCERQLSGVRRLIVVPDGPLHDLPFQALVANGRYLIETCEVVYAPSATLLRRLRGESFGARDRAPATGTLVCADPDFGGRYWRPATTRATLGSLPFARDEGEAIKTVYGDDAVLLVGVGATEEQVKQAAPGRRILHFATHGLIDAVNPLYSALVLAQPPEGSCEDGFLEAREIAGLEWNADMAVLSACESANGRTMGGEGVMGLTWALLCAGVPTTVATQWRVDDRSTSLLMREFYHQLAKGKPKAAALRAAQLSLLRDRQYAEPYYWAPFVLIGRWD